MVIYEIENMETHETGYVQAATERDMICGLKDRGFKQIAGLDFLAGHNSKGEEISAMPHNFAPVTRLRHINQQ